MTARAPRGSRAGACAPGGGDMGAGVPRGSGAGSPRGRRGGPACVCTGVPSAGLPPGVELGLNWPILVARPSASSAKSRPLRFRPGALAGASSRDTLTGDKSSKPVETIGLIDGGEAPEDKCASDGGALVGLLAPASSDCTSIFEASEPLAATLSSADIDA